MRLAVLNLVFDFIAKLIYSTIAERDALQY